MTSAALILLFVAQTKAIELPTGLLSGLCYVESAHKISAKKKEKDSSYSLGVCEIKLNTARMVGFVGTSESLMKPGVNIKYAAKYLKYQIVRYHGDLYKAIGAYNSGTYHQNHGGRARNEAYISKVLNAWARRK